ncbi:homoserine O-acetyltransferase/O-succinyltransferase family protein [Massilia rubra]|uniref:Homoserine O-succinyltransferase n=1 Tax=Massilia rubra TaxID=2607910 RepID=A0ABX0LSG7_9BURK|nr:homoserine O-succinyltransferase [Massilia rubra]NHZ35815.1 homoserine O-succinyltransferase [Massilia rubra]
MKKLHIGLINIMPNAVEYECLLRAALEDHQQDVEIHCIRLETHRYHSSQSGCMPYPSFFELVERIDLDLLILSGAPVEHLPYAEISYWQELTTILGFAERRVRSVMGICFGGLALAKYLGVNKRVLPEKQYGLFNFRLTPAGVRSLAGQGAEFHLPYSSWAELDAADVARSGLEVVASCDQLGPGVLQSRDRKFFIVLGHPEYTADTLRAEWMRDQAKALAYTHAFDHASFERMRQQLRAEAGNLLAHWVSTHLVPSNQPTSLVHE